MAITSVILLAFNVVGCSDDDSSGNTVLDDNTIVESGNVEITLLNEANDLIFYDSEDILINLKGESDSGLAKMGVRDSSGNELESTTSFTNSALAEKQFNIGIYQAGSYSFVGYATDVDGVEDTVDIAITVNSDGGSNLVFHVSFDGGSANDIAGGIVPTSSGSPTFSNDMDGGENNAYQGADESYFLYDISNATWLDQDFSVTFWYKDNNNSVRAGIISTWNSYNGFALLRRDSGFSSNWGTSSGDTWCGSSATDEGSSGSSVNITDAPFTGEWQFIAYTFDGSVISMYVDGVLAQTRTLDSGVTLIYEGVTTLSIGSGLPNYERYSYEDTLGQIDDVKIFDQSLSLAAVIELMNEGI